MSRDDLCRMRNDVYLYPNEVLVYENDEWGIIQDNKSRGTYATHRCKSANPPKYGEYCWEDEEYVESKDLICKFCKDRVPDNIITLVRIDNWKR